MDWEVRRPQKTIIKREPTGMGANNYFLERDEVRLYATEVTDRFGNWVRYSYSGDRLTRILASDGREITLTHFASGANVGLIETVVANGRTWRYDYAGGERRLTSVQLPDASRWTLETKWLTLSYLTPANLPPCELAPLGAASIPQSYRFVHPSGATGVFTFTPVRHRRGGIPQSVACRASVKGVEEGVARDFNVYALSQKTLSGPSLTPLTWTLTFALQAVGQLSKVVTLNLPDGSSQRMVFGSAYYVDEAKLNVNQVLSSAPSTLLTQTAYRYADHPAAPAYAYHVGRGPDTKLLDEFAQAYAVPIDRTEVIQQGVAFVRTVTSFDRFARSVSETQASSLGFSRTQTQSFEDRFDRWVIGLPRVSMIDGITTSELSYDSAGLPEERSEYGQLIARYTYAADGTLATAADGLNQITTLSAWKRGYPQRLDFSDATFKTAVIDDNGWISAINNELGDQSCYGYDSMGRLSSQTLPSETSTGVCDASAWTPTSWQFTQINSAEYGIEPGHWKRTETTGARSAETVYDALWRPIFTRQSSSDGSVGVRTVRRSFDHAGRETFASYPGVDVASYLTLATGVRTGYDGLGRVLSTEVDSERSPAILRSSTAYLANFVTQTTNARGFATTSSYQAFEQPSTDAPMQISAPESQITTYTRDVFGKPITITRSGSYTAPGQPTENQTLTRRYVYDAFQRLCKSIEPESGITVLDYDAANNVQWQAIAQNSLSSTSDCQRSSVPAAQRARHYFDARNRLTRIDHPTGSDDIGYQYDADGAVQIASTGTLDGNLPPNFASTKNSWTYGYNKRRLLTGETLQLDGKSFALSWRYNASGDQEGLIYPSGLDISFLPNAYGEPRQAGAFASSVTRHPNGAINRLSYGNGLVQSTTQNLRQLPLRRSVGALMDHTHLYDASANIVTLTDGSAGAKETRNLAYDGLDRMIQADAANQLGNERYRFDALDNLRQASIGSNTFVHTLDSQNRLSQIQKDGVAYVNYSHNAQGDTTLRSVAGSGSENLFANGFENPLSAPKFAPHQVLNYDRAHRLTSITGVESYQYDAHGRRVITTRTSDGLKRYQLYSNAGVLMHAEDQRTSEVIDYVNLEGQLVAERTTPLFGGLVTTRYQHADLRGSPTVVSNAGGTQIERSIEQPFGAPYDGIYRDGPGFTGHATDAASGLTYMQQRYYDPIAMRFLSVDPAQSEFNRYSYGANNPFKFVDPDGRENREFNFENRGTIPPPRSPNDRLGPALGVALAAIVAVPAAVGGGIAVIANPVAAVEIATAATEIAAGDALGGAALGAAAVGAGKAVSAIADNAMVVRAGAGTTEDAFKIGSHPSGPVGFSVESANGASFQELCANCINNQVRETTAGQIRAAGGDVLSTSGASSTHATVTNLSGAKANEVFSAPKSNPVPKSERLKRDK
jgi:RHS repeat-associated protein